MTELTTQQGLGTCKGHRTPATLTRTSPTIPGGPFKRQHCFLTKSTPTSPHQGEPCEASGAGTILSYSWKKLSTLSHCPRSTLQPRCPIFLPGILPIALLEPMPWEGPPMALKRSTPYSLASQWPEPGSYHWGHWVPWPTVNMHTSKLLSHWLGVLPLTQVDNLALAEKRSDINHKCSSMSEAIQWDLSHCWLSFLLEYNSCNYLKRETHTHRTRQVLWIFHLT